MKLVIDKLACATRHGSKLFSSHFLLPTTVEKDSNANVVSDGELLRGTGRCKWFNVLKGFGFLVTDDEQEVFVHQSAIQMDGFRSLAQDEAVEFEYKQSDKGFEATKVCGPGENILWLYLLLNLILKLPLIILCTT